MMGTSKKILQQILLFVSMYSGYTFYTLNRSSFTFVLPKIIDSGEISANFAGQVISAFSIAYTVGKFVSGLFVDRFSPSIMFSLGLLSCGLINIAFSYSSSHYFLFLWFLNGICQGPGWPACGKFLKSWYPADRLGTLWSLLSTCMNLAASTGPLFASWYLMGKPNEEWRVILKLFGVTASILSCFTFLSMKDEPGKNFEDFIDIEESLKSTKEKKSAKNLWKEILTSPYIYALAFGNFTNVFIKGILVNWGAFYLMNEKKASLSSSSQILASIELGGICGRVVTGILSDALVSYIGRQNKGHPRHILILIQQLILITALYYLRVFITMIDEHYIQSVFCAFLIGFSTYGSISSVGVLSLENCESSMSGSTSAFSALFGNLGLVCAGFPFSYLATQFSWSTAFQITEYLITVVIVVVTTFQWKLCYIGTRTKTD